MVCGWPRLRLGILAPDSFGNPLGNAGVRMRSFFLTGLSASAIPPVGTAQTATDRVLEVQR